jgi:predicted transcriptional regulator
MTDAPRRSKSAKKLSDADIESYAAEAEAGYDVDELIGRRGKRGRPTLGSGPASVESVRLDPEMREALATRAEAEGTSTSEVIRQALREYLEAG